MCMIHPKFYLLIKSTWNPVAHIEDPNKSWLSTEFTIYWDQINVFNINQKKNGVGDHIPNPRRFSTSFPTHRDCMLAQAADGTLLLQSPLRGCEGTQILPVDIGSIDCKSNVPVIFPCRGNHTRINQGWSMDWREYLPHDLMAIELFPM